MKAPKFLLAYLLCIMYSTSLIEANIITKITDGGKEAFEYVKNFCNVMGDLAPVNTAVNGALTGMSNVLTSINNNVQSIQKASIDMNAATTHFNQVDSVDMSDLHTIIPKSQQAVKDIITISTNVSYIITDIGNMANAIQSNTPSVAGATKEISDMMYKIAKLINNNHPENESIYKNGTTAEKIGNELPQKVTNFYNKFVKIQHQINNGIHTIQQKTNQIMSEAAKPLQQLQHFLNKLPQNKISKLEDLLKSHPYQAVKGAA